LRVLTRWPASARCTGCRTDEGTPVVRLREYDQDPTALLAHDVLPAAFAPVRKGPARSFWSVGSMTAIGSWPGGRLEVGESAAQAVIREVAEELGVTLALTGLSGVYGDPTHVLLDPMAPVTRSRRCASTPSLPRRTPPKRPARTGSKPSRRPGAPLRARDLVMT